MDERRKNSGRRATDVWLTRTGGIAVVSGMLYSVAAWGMPLVGLSEKVAVLSEKVHNLEATHNALLFMTCIMYRDQHPDTLPVICDSAISHGPGR